MSSQGPEAGSNHSTSILKRARTSHYVPSRYLISSRLALVRTCTVSMRLVCNPLVPNLPQRACLTERIPNPSARQGLLGSLWRFRLRAERILECGGVRFGLI